MTKSYLRIYFFIFAIAWQNSFASTCNSKSKEFRNAGISESIDDGVARFYAVGTDVQELPPSMALVKKINRIGEVPAKWKTKPLFRCDVNDYTVWVKTKKTTSLYGTGEIAGSLLRNGSVTEAWNTDSWAYTRENKQLYQSHPWVLAVRKDGSSFGVLADTTYKCQIDLRDGIKFSTNGQPFAAIIIEGQNPQMVLKKLAKLIGTMQLPPKWAFGYHQCRWSYLTAERAREVAKEFRKRNIPCDAIWFDIDYMENFKIFTYSKKNFPDPNGLNKFLHDRGFKSVCIIDPGVKQEKGYFVYDQGTADNHWVKTADGCEFTGEVWPGMCVFPDFTRSQTRIWWTNLVAMFVMFGVDGIWLDMNEPAVWNEPKTMPDNCIFRGDANFSAGAHSQYHNIYGMLQSQATKEGLLKAKPDKRPFILTRANYIGGQRYASTWTGDNTADWQHLDDSIPMVLNLGLSGQPLSGPDIGGFNGNGNPELFARWIGVGSLLPFSRGHTAQGTIDKEPWAFGQSVEDTSRKALQRRYRLLPYIYTLAYEAATEGLPIARPVFFADPQDSKLRSIDDAFLLGSDMLVLPQLSKETVVESSLPKGIWRQINILDEDESQDPNLPKIKIRGGAIVPLGKIIENTMENSLDPLTLLVCLDKKGRASGRLYEDDGDGFDYEKGKYLLTEYEAQKKKELVTIKIKSRTGNLAVPRRKIVVKIIDESGFIEYSANETDNMIANINMKKFRK